MKDTILFPIVYILVFAIALSVLCILNIVYTAGAGASLLPALSQDLLVALIPHAVATMFVLALFLTNFFLLIRLQRKPGLRFASFLLILLCSLLIFLLGFDFINANYAKGELPRGGKIAETRDIAVPQKLIPFKEATLYVEDTEGSRLQNIVIINNSPAAPDIAFYKTGLLSLSGNSVVLNPSGASSAQVSLSPQPPLSSVFAAEGVIALLISHYDKLCATLNDLYNTKRTEFYLFSLSFLLLMLTAGFFMRLSRWPLFNAFLYIFVLLLIFIFNNFVVYTMIPEIEKFIGRNFLLNIMPSVIMLILAATFFLLDFVFLPQTKYRRKRLSV
ncbi:MAG: hypothetical protein JW822_09485 [Spirochaetales bacterium]|nr:hypothetical protein [Spirochaetales bacterium]